MPSEFASKFAERAHAARNRFLELLPDARAEQERLLRTILATNRDTVFGREHGFERITSTAEYRRAVPIRTYEELSPWLQRTIAGEEKVLSALSPMIFIRTTGTTGEPKLIPTTKQANLRWNQDLLIAWGNYITHHPQLLERDDTTVVLQIAPKPFDTFTKTGIPIHANTELPVYPNGAFPYSRTPWFPPPFGLTDAERLYWLLRRSAEHPLIAMFCLHSSRLQAVVSLLEREGPHLIREIRDGTIAGQPALPPNPDRARQLEAILARGPLLPRSIWPSLQFLSCWTGASFELFRPEIDRAFGVSIIPQMVLSSEAGPMTMPIDCELHPGVLTIYGNVYEFMPIDDAGGVDRERTLGFEELEDGRAYEIVFTNRCGLYRYHCGDRFRVQGFVSGVPRLEFLGRSGVSDMAGEKINESHVAAAMTDALASLELVAVNTTLCAQFGRPCRYLALIEPAGDWSAERISNLAVTLDRALEKQAPRYELKRGFGDVGPLSVELVSKGTFERYRQRRIEEGVPATQMKDRILHFHFESEVISVLQQLSRQSSA